MIIWEILMIVLILFAYIGLIPFSYFVDELKDSYTTKNILKNMGGVLISSLIVIGLCFGSILCHCYYTQNTRIETTICE